MDWHPLRLSTPVAQHVFGARRIPDDFGRENLPNGRIAETWECSDVEEKIAVVQNGALAGRSLRDLAMQHPDELVGAGWRGPYFPVLIKFIDGSGILPVHLHAADDAAQRLEGQPNGKTEAWHILWAAPGATALVGTRPGIDRTTLREALLREDYDAVMRRLPVRPGETVYVPGGTLHSFGPDTLIYEIEQTSDIQQHAMPWRMEDGSRLDRSKWESNIDKLLEEWRPEPRPSFRPPLRLPEQDGAFRQICCAGPYFALERWGVSGGSRLRHEFGGALILSNVGAPARLRCGGRLGTLGRAESLLLPAALGTVEVDGPADLLVGSLPDLERDIRQPLAAAGYAPEQIAALGEGLGG
jgi:mannose-6-phosphate isomerase